MASINWRALAPIGVFFLLCIVIAIFSPNFLSVSNAIRILNASAIPVVLVMGATFVILMGSIDLSVEGIVALCAVVTASLVLNDTFSADLGLWAIPVAIIAGGLIGGVNGATHVYLKVPSFMVTLGIGFVCLGIATAALGGFPVRISDRGFRALTLGRTLGLPNGIWVAAAAVAVALLIQERTRLGRYVFAIGTDEITARQSGVPVERTRVLVFILAGLFSGLAGSMAAAPTGSGPCTHCFRSTVYHDNRGRRWRYGALGRCRFSAEFRCRGADRHCPHQWDGPHGCATIRAAGCPGIPDHCRGDTGS